MQWQNDESEGEPPLKRTCVSRGNCPEAPLPMANQTLPQLAHEHFLSPFSFLYSPSRPSLLFSLTPSPPLSPPSLLPHPCPHPPSPLPSIQAQDQVQLESQPFQNSSVLQFPSLPSSLPQIKSAKPCDSDQFRSTIAYYGLTYTVHTIICDLTAYRNNNGEKISNADIEYAVATGEYLMAELFTCLDQTLGRQNSCLWSMQENYEWLQDDDAVNSLHEFLSITRETRSMCKNTNTRGYFLAHQTTVPSFQQGYTLPLDVSKESHATPDPKPYAKAKASTQSNQVTCPITDLVSDSNLPQSAPITVPTTPAACGTIACRVTLSAYKLPLFEDLRTRSNTFHQHCVEAVETYCRTQENANKLAHEKEVSSRDLMKYLRELCATNKAIKKGGQDLSMLMIPQALRERLASDAIVHFKRWKQLDNTECIHPKHWTLDYIPLSASVWGKNGKAYASLLCREGLGGGVDVPNALVGPCRLYITPRGHYILEMPAQVTKTHFSACHLSPSLAKAWKLAVEGPDLLVNDFDL